MYRRSRVAGVSVAAVAALVCSVLPAAASAPAPEAGAAYQGHISGTSPSQDSVTFKVSEDGNRVVDLEIGPYPTDGCGSGGDVPDQSSEPARIRHGRFTAHVVFSGEPGIVARSTVTGTFLRHGKEKGKVTTHPTGSPECDITLPYTTHAQ
ncbi:hypothetical protein [Nocardioides aquiterrae]|uniref:Uncharacterized protein n=1 Tax=Nocardioides aquiterrae TaxID=203799 RepID=A0ABN1UJY1_9ACTN